MLSHWLDNIFLFKNLRTINSDIFENTLGYRRQLCALMSRTRFHVLRTLFSLSEPKAQVSAFNHNMSVVRRRRCRRRC